MAPEHPDSDYRMAYETLVAHVPVPAENVHRMHGEDEPAQAGDAAPQAGTGADAGLQAEPGCDEVLEVPVLDLVLLGLGENGHTASLFPHSPALTERRRLVVPVEVDDRIPHRLTVTVPVLNGAREVVFLVQGAGKADVVHRVLEGPYEPDELPAQLIAPHDGSLVWLLDGPAASLLQRAR